MVAENKCVVLLAEVVNRRNEQEGVLIVPECTILHLIRYYDLKFYWQNCEALQISKEDPFSFVP